MSSGRSRGAPRWRGGRPVRWAGPLWLAAHGLPAAAAQVVPFDVGSLVLLVLAVILGAAYAVAGWRAAVTLVVCFFVWLGYVSVQSEYKRRARAAEVVARGEAQRALCRQLAAEEGEPFAPPLKVVVRVARELLRSNEQYLGARPGPDGVEFVLSVPEGLPERGMFLDITRQPHAVEGLEKPFDRVLTTVTDSRGVVRAKRIDVVSGTQGCSGEEFKTGQERFARRWLGASLGWIDPHRESALPGPSGSVQGRIGAPVNGRFREREEPGHVREDDELRGLLPRLGCVERSRYSGEARCAGGGAHENAVATHGAIGYQLMADRWLLISRGGAQNELILTTRDFQGRVLDRRQVWWRGLAPITKTLPFPVIVGQFALDARGFQAELLYGKSFQNAGETGAVTRMGAFDHKVDFEVTWPASGATGRLSGS